MASSKAPVNAVGTSQLSGQFYIDSEVLKKLLLNEDDHDLSSDDSILSHINLDKQKQKKKKKGSSSTVKLKLKKRGKAHKKIVPYDRLIRLSWNSQGLGLWGRPRNIKFRREMLAERKVNFIGIQEANKKIIS
jgi:hypothetical protein